MSTIKKYLVKHYDGLIEIHYDGIFQLGDVAYCGHDLRGDNEWETGIETNKKVNCIGCIRLLEHSKEILKNNQP